MRKNLDTIFTFFLITLYSLTFRLIPFKIPNFEPVLSFQIFINKKNKILFSTLFGFFNIFIFDLISLKIGIWTIVTSLIFGMLPFIYKLLNKLNINNIFLLTIFGTIIFDITTSLIGPLFYNQSLKEAVINQIPFTFYHLIGNIFFTLVLNFVINIYKEKVKKLIYFKNLGVK